MVIISGGRNIVLVTLDSVRADHCSIYGYSRNTTPTLQKLKKKSMIFDRAFASGVPTFASLVGLFTGSYSYNDSLSGDFSNAEKWKKEIQSKHFLPDILRRYGGYYTIGIHSNPWASRFYGFNKGFTFFNDFINCNSGGKVNLNIFTDSKLYNIYKFSKSFLLSESMFMTWEKLYNNIIESVSRVNTQPYFLWILLVDTHLPYIPPRKFRKFCTKFTLPLIFSNYILRKEWMIRKESFSQLYSKIKSDVKSSGSDILNNLKDTIVGAYDSCIYYSDFFIKRILRDLSDTDPVFIIGADHGEGFGEHNFFYHPPFLYNELTNVPLVIYNADVCGRIENNISLLNLPPTILDIAGIENRYFIGSSLFDLCSSDQKQPVISKTVVGGKLLLSVIDDEWKLILDYDGAKLYNILEDYYEQRNVVYDKLNIAAKLIKKAKENVSQSYIDISKCNLKASIRRIRRRGVKL